MSNKNLNAKLSGTIRLMISNKILDHRFSQGDKDLKAKEHALALDLYNLIYPENVRKAMAALPANFLPTSNNVRARVDGFNYDLKLTVYLTGNHDCVYGSGHRFENGSKLGAKLEARVKALYEERQAYKSEKDAAKRDVDNTLAAFSTYKQLLDNWPEIEPFVDVPEGVNRTMPVALVADLNAKLGLPVKKAKDKRTAPEKKVA